MKKKKWYVVTALVLGVCLSIQNISVSRADDNTDWFSVWAGDEKVTGASLETSDLFIEVGQTEKVKIVLEPETASYSSASMQIAPSGVVEARYVEESGKLYVCVTGKTVGSSVVTMEVDGFSMTLNITVTGKSVQKHTKAEIRTYLKKHKASVNTKVKYKKKPKVKAAYRAGVLSNKTKKAALRMLNNIRYIAGLNANVTLNHSYGKKAQAAALVNAANGVLSHSPSRPAKMKKSLYNLGASGAGASNISMGYQNLNAALVSGWMSDDDSYNIDRVGHRRWILNPLMKQTGFGAVNSYMAMYALDKKGSGTQTNVYWPAQTMPLEYFGVNDPWTVSTGQTLKKSKIKVTLKRMSDGKTWTFSSKTNKKSKKLGYFNVNNDGYGLIGCVIFRPNKIKYKSGNKFSVKITGIPTGDIEYQVVFFKL